MNNERMSWVVIVLPVLGVLALAGGLAWLPSLMREEAAPARQEAVASRPASTVANMEFVPISGGTFIMGGNPAEGVSAELPPRRVSVRPFYMGKYEVTQAEWEAVMGKNPSAYRNPHRPVEQVTFEAAQEFIRRLNQREGAPRYRLPSEAEWEYAARAGTASRWFFGDDPAALERYAWYGHDGETGTRLAGRGEPNPWGLYDVYGNVWEWTADCWHADYQGAPAEGHPRLSGDCSTRMLRGGGWNSPAEYARSAVRGSYAVNIDDRANGLRLVRVW